MRWARLLFLVPAALAAQPPGLVRGVLLECDHGANGEFAVRTATHEVYRFRFDSGTYFESDQQRAQPEQLRNGEQVEVVADRIEGSALRYARTLHVLRPAATPRPVSAGRLRVPRSSLESSLLPLGNLTFAGFVSRVDGERLVLRLRGAESKTILLRPDTRCLEGGAAVTPSELKPNMRVFVRAGQDLYGEVEAYQVIWGEILRP